MARFFLALTEAANFPAASKAVSEWFGPSERAFATGIFISGVGAGAIVASLMVPPLAASVGWQWTFVITGLMGFGWFVLWTIFYRSPQVHPWLTETDRALLPPQVSAAAAAKVPWASLLGYRETWAYGLSKSLIDPIFWFLMFWLPKFLAESHGIRGVEVVPYLTAVYICADIGSMGAGYVSSLLVKRGWGLNSARKVTMLVLTLIASPMIVTAGFMRDPVIAIVLIAIVCGMHQAWAAMVWTLPTDLFPSQATASVAGIGAAAASVVAIVTAEFTGRYLNLHPGDYTPIFAVAGLLYPLALLVVHLFSPRLEQAPAAYSPAHGSIDMTLSRKVRPGETTTEEPRAPSAQPPVTGLAKAAGERHSKMVRPATGEERASARALLAAPRGDDGGCRLRSEPRSIVSAVPSRGPPPTSRRSAA